MKMNSWIFFCFSLLILTSCTATDVSHDGRAITINGQRKIVLSGSIHYPRSTSEMWPDLIKKAKEGGLDAVETYVFWNAHEALRRQYDFTGNLDLIRFIKTVQDQGLYAVLRIGPFKNWGGKDPYRTAEDVAFSVARFFQLGGTFQNYYMATIYSTNDQQTCFFGNANTTTDASVTYQGVKYNVPAWSVSILPDCKNEVFNTAKVNTQTSKMVKVSNKAENEPIALKWTWMPESVDETLVHGKGEASASHLLDQKVANDVSDYMWYMTSLQLGKGDPIWSDNMRIRVNGTGHAMHAYINGEHLGSQWATYGVFNYRFEKRIKLKPGRNQITLLSATIGLQNYGPNFDEIRTGLPGPIEVIGEKGDECIIKDLSNHTWTYKLGLDGFNMKLFDNAHDKVWSTGELPINKMMTWYKTTFKAPLGEEPVAVDLQGLGKGMAWVNGNSLGRYWPSYMAEEDGCSAEPCDYRGSYDNSKCVTNCGQPTQRWYHVPRSFLNRDVNELVLFEEIGGNPSLVNFQTVRPGTVCGNAYEEKDMELSCYGRPISGIKFASFGNVQGVCGAFQKGTCEAKNDVLSVVQNACVGKESCVVRASESSLGSTSCDSNTTKRLVVEAIC
ncbi:Beta-galactosidase [Sesamum angolense]|uniref:beta-galactosidase n=1 Tax=Sesamum angolense TaxID=2727404 RepID=A0AAE1W361_9LAMI|nr:Beta-galactosidase [Sesamum angolense]